jgi:hypothetical protein
MKSNCANPISSIVSFNIRHQDEKLLEIGSIWSTVNILKATTTFVQKSEHFSRQHTTQTNKPMLKLKLKKFSTIFPYSRKEKMHTFCENIAKIYINLPVPNKCRRPSFYSSTLNTDYSILSNKIKK